MAYTKKTWKNNETKLSAENLNNIESGLEAAATKADEAAAKATANTTTINGHTTAINGLTTSLNGLTTTVNSNKTAADSMFTSVGNRIAAVEQENSTQNSAISTLGSEVTRVEGKFDSSVANLTSSISTTNTNLTSHKNAKNNPHGVTAAQVDAYSKNEIDTINSSRSVAITITQGDTSDQIANVDNISPLPQKVLINTTKEGDLELNDWSYSGGENSLWTIEYNSTVLHTLEEDSDFGYNLASSIPNHTFDFIKKDINGEDLIAYNFSYNAIPDNYLSTMRYIYPVYTNNSSGFSLNYGDGANYCYITLILRSDSQKKIYLVPFGTNGNSYERLMFSIVSNRYLLIKGNYVYKRVIDLKAYGDDLVFYSMGFHNLIDGGTVRLQDVTPKYPSFALYTDMGATVVPITPLLSQGTYELDITPPADFDYFIYFIQNSNSNIGISNNLQYAPDNSNLMSLGRNIPSSIDMDKLNRDMELKAQLAVKRLINVGTTDPEASTPGLLYFKYLP